MATALIAGAIIGVAGAFAGGVMQASATHKKIEEGKEDYAKEIEIQEANLADQQAEYERQLKQVKVEGVSNLRDIQREAAYQAGVANTKAQMTVSGTVARMGASGTRAAASPLLAQQQAAEAAYAEAANVTASARSAVRLGGLKLGGSLADIQAQKTLLTNRSLRDIDELKRKKKQLEDNQKAAEQAAFWGGFLPGAVSAVGTAV